MSIKEKRLNCLMLRLLLSDLEGYKNNLQTRKEVKRRVLGFLFFNKN